MKDKKGLENEILDLEELDEDQLDDFYDDYYDDYYDEDKPKFGEEQFDKTLHDKDYYAKRNEELQNEYDKLKEESEKDTIELPKEKEDKQELANSSQDNGALDEAKKDANSSINDTNKQDDGKETEKNENHDKSKEDKSVDDKSTEDKKSKNDNNNREVLGIKEDGTKVVRKNAQDRKNDQQNLKNAQKNIRNNKIDEKMAKAYGLTHPIEALKKKAKAKIAEKLLPLLAKVAPDILAALGIILGCIILFCLIGGIISYYVNRNQTGIAGYYNAPCQEITVVGVYNESTGSYSQGGTYSIEEYVAGVLASEVGNANNMEVYKAFAIAIRTYTFRNVDSSCSIENSTRKQTFSETTNEDLIKAAKETMGIVLVDESDSLISTMYDSCYIINGDANSPSITIGQKNQIIDGNWYRNNIHKFAGGGHGQGMSQCGSYYLGDSGYTYDQILKYYYDEIVFKSTFMTTGIEGLEEYPLDSTGTVVLRVSLDEILNRTTADGFTSLNQRISDKVNQVGYQTRGGVVAAAVTLIGEVGNLGYRVPYYWGGGQGFDSVDMGARNYWGGSSTGSKRCYTHANNIDYDLCGLDCGGFVNWAIYNAGFRTPAAGSDNFTKAGEVVSLKADEAVVQAGDLLHTPGHIMLVVGVDFNTNEYIIAEAAGYRKGVLFSRRSFGTKGEGVRMDRFYNNEANKR